MSTLTPSQTIGPFFHEGLKWALDAGEAKPTDGSVRVTGKVLDRDAKPANDALLEIWQPAWAHGRFGGLQRVFTHEDGRFVFLMPAPVRQQFHANVMIFARGLLRGMLTRVYLHPSDDPAALVLPAEVPAERRGTLIARRIGQDDVRKGRSQVGDVYAWDIRLQGEGETVFFELQT
ncbi:MAG TPA: hypothetical protein VFA81_11385 [Burkholderiales bacterium]|nr:hypothetical protein [Burkholderiales bacterium]